MSSKRVRVGTPLVLGDHIWLAIWSFLSINKSAALKRVCKHWQLLLSTRPQPIGPEEVCLDETLDVRSPRFLYYQLNRPVNVRVWIVYGMWAKEALTLLKPSIVTCRLHCDDYRQETNQALIEATTLVQATVQELLITGRMLTGSNEIYKLEMPALKRLLVDVHAIGPWAIGSLSRSAFIGRLERLSFSISNAFNLDGDEESNDHLVGALMGACTSLRYLTITLNYYYPFRLMEYIARVHTLEELVVTGGHVSVNVDERTLAELAPLTNLESITWVDCVDQTAKSAAQLAAMRPSIKFR